MPLARTQNMAVRRQGEWISFDTQLTDDEAIAICQTLPGKFPQDLVAKKDNGLSPTQWAWVHYLAWEHIRGQQTQAVNLLNVVKMFETASKSLKLPRITLMIGDQKLRLKRCGQQSRYPGAVNVTDGGSFEDGKFFGRINVDGTFTTGKFPLPEQLFALLADLSQKPAEVAAAYGRATGHCCFCGLELTDPRSVSVGYGPICSERFMLPWG